ncbi:MAG: AAA family ATPase [Acidimicrobiia bacterium]|nr:AAA family ATPase [Acidimicrobiia bacterium]
MSEEQHHRLSVRLLGPFEVAVDGETHDDFESDSARGLLAFLASEPGRRWSRAVLAEMMWPDRPEGAATSNLRHTLSVLRTALGDRDTDEPVIVADRNTVGFTTPIGVNVDLIDFENLATAATERSDAVEAWEAAIALWRGGLLEGLRLKAGVAWEEWFAVTEERLRRTLADLLRRLGAHYERAGMLDEAIASAYRLIEIDPWDERGHRRLLRLLARNNQRSDALRHYATLTKLLERDLGAGPATETSLLAEQIRDGDVETATGTVDVAYPNWIYESQRPPPPPLFVGRRFELDWLTDHLDAALAGHGRVVLISGEAGSGKTMVCRRFTEAAQERSPGLLTSSGRCNAHGGIGDPYLPFREVLAQLTGDVRGQYQAGALTREQATQLWEAIPLTTRLLHERAGSHVGVTVNGSSLVARLEEAMPSARWLDGLRGRVAAAQQAMSPTRVQPALFAELGAFLEGLSELHPLVLVIDDLQWADAGSIGLLWHLARRIGGLPVLIIGTFRTEELADVGDDERRVTLREIEALTPDATLELTADRSFVDELLDAEPNDLDSAYRDRLFEYTNGNPLLTVEMLRGMQDRGDVRRDAAGVWRASDRLDWDEVPSRVEAMVGLRLDRLPDDVRRDLVAAAVQGQEFVVEVAADAQSEPELADRISREATSGHGLLETVDIERVGERIVSRVRFRHALLQRYVYRRIGDRERIGLHESTGRALESLYAGHADPPVVDLAYHFDTAGLAEPAVRYLLVAGQRAYRMSANEEAVLHLSRAHELLPQLPATVERDQTELTLLVALQAPVMAVRGYASPEAQRIGARADQLCQTAPPSPLTAMALAGLGQVHGLSSRYREAERCDLASLAAAEAVGSPALESLARLGLGYSQTWGGRLVEGSTQLRRARELFDPQRDAWLGQVYGIALGPEVLAWLAVNALQRGYLDEAIDLADEGIAMAREIAHPFSLCHAVAVAGAVVRSMRGDGEAMAPFIEEVETIARVEHFPMYSAAAMIYRGMAALRLGRPDEAIALVSAGVAAWHEIGIDAFAGSMHGEMAEGEGAVGRTEAAIARIDRELPAVVDRGEGLSELILRMQRGRLLAATSADGAESALRRAIADAEAAEARLQHLRAATALAEHLVGRDDPAGARSTLEPILSWFTEGLDTRYVVQAAEVLERL